MIHEGICCCHGGKRIVGPSRCGSAGASPAGQRAISGTGKIAKRRIALAEKRSLLADKVKSCSAVSIWIRQTNWTSRRCVCGRV